MNKPQSLVHILDVPVQLVALDKMVVPPEYQRTLNEVRITRMSQAFDPDLVGILTVARRPDGTYALIDGQHRWHLLVQMGYTTVTCEVFDDINVAREAQLYRQRNSSQGRTALNSRSAFKARLVEGDPLAIDIKRIVEESGFQLDLSNQPAARTVGAVDALETVYLWGPDLLAMTLWIIGHAWVNNETFIAYGEVIFGVAAFQKTYPEAEPGEIARKLNAFTVAHILASARSAASLSNIPQWIGVTEAVWAAYNRQRKSKVLERRVISKVARRTWKRSRA